MPDVKTQTIEKTSVDAIDELTAMTGPVVVTLRHVNRWQTAMGHLFAQESGLLFVQIEHEDGAQGECFRPVPGQQVGVSFRHRGDKYAFASSLRQYDPSRTQEGDPSGAYRGSQHESYRLRDSQRQMKRKRMEKKEN